jgi:hypothetical protein
LRAPAPALTRRTFRGRPSPGTSLIWNDPLSKGL